MRRNGPKQSLAKHVATLKQLRDMTERQREERTCGTCQITYTAPSYARECSRWHNGD
jgi:hypothetical protein